MAESSSRDGDRSGAGGSVSRKGGGQRPNSPTRLVTVEHVARVTPGLTRVTFTGDALAGFGPPRPGAHMKLLFAPEGSNWSPEDATAPRPQRRTYTPRRFDPVRRRLEIEFVHHGDGLAAKWAAAAKPGDTLYINGPGGGYDVQLDATELFLIADDTAMPAAGTIIEAMPAGCRAVVLCEVADAAERRPLSPLIEVSPTWLCRDGNNSIPGSMLENAARNLAAPSPTAYWWIACEAAAMRRIRHHLIGERGIEPARIHTRGYWKLGETAYPDHDFGKD